MKSSPGMTPRNFMFTNFKNPNAIVRHAMNPAKEAVGVKAPIIVRNSPRSTVVLSVTRVDVSGRNPGTVATFSVPVDVPDRSNRIV